MVTKFQQLVADSMSAPTREFEVLDSEKAIKELESMEFCAELVATLRKELPEEFENHEFYRWVKQEGDIYVCWGVQKPISIQIDPHCEVIVALGDEFGSWTENDNAVKSFLTAYRNWAAKSA